MSGRSVETIMEEFRVLEHTADIGFEAYGATCEEVFANAARALESLMVDLKSIASLEETKIQVEGSDAQNLLVNWLSEVLYLFDAEGRLFHDFKVSIAGEKALAATARGEPFDRAKHQVNLQVKAITYHQLALEQTPAGWRAQVYVDI